jgi:hypothetical protein
MDPTAGSIIWKFDANEYPGTGDSYTDPRGIVWGMTAPGSIVPMVPAVPPVWNPPESTAWPWTLGVFLNWLVRVWYTHPVHFWGYAVCLHVQSIEHRITPDDWFTMLAVDRPESFTELLWASNGWDTGLWDEALWDQAG